MTQLNYCLLVDGKSTVMLNSCYMVRRHGWVLFQESPSIVLVYSWVNTLDIRIPFTKWLISHCEQGHLDCKCSDDLNLRFSIWLSAVVNKIPRLQLEWARSARVECVLHLLAFPAFNSMRKWNRSVFTYFLSRLMIHFKRWYVAVASFSAQSRSLLPMINLTHCSFRSNFLSISSSHWISNREDKHLNRAPKSGQRTHARVKCKSFISATLPNCWELLSNLVRSSFPSWKGW